VICTNDTRFIVHFTRYLYLYSYKIKFRQPFKLCKTREQFHEIRTNFKKTINGISFVTSSQSDHRHSKTFDCISALVQIRAVFFKSALVSLRKITGRAIKKHSKQVKTTTEIFAEYIKIVLATTKAYFCSICRSPHIHHYRHRLHSLHGCSIWRTHGKCIRRMGQILRKK